MVNSSSTRAAIAQLRLTTRRAAAGSPPVSPLQGTAGEYHHPAYQAYAQADAACKYAPDHESWLRAAEARAAAWEALIAAGLVRA